MLFTWEICCQEFVHPCATDWLAKGMCLDFQQEQEICHSPQHPVQFWGPHNFFCSWYWGVFYPEVEWLGHEADQSSSRSAEVKNAWSCISTLIYVSVVWCLIKLRGSFLLYCLRVWRCILTAQWSTNTYYKLLLCVCGTHCSIKWSCDTSLQHFWWFSWLL